MSKQDNFKESEALDVFFRDVQKAHHRNGFEMRTKSPLKKKGTAKKLLKKGVEAAGKSLRNKADQKASGLHQAGTKFSAGKSFDISKSRKAKKDKKKIAKWESEKPSELDKFLAMDKANKSKSPAKAVYGPTRRSKGIAGVYKARKRAGSKPYQSFADVARKPKKKK